MAKSAKRHVATDNLSTVLDGNEGDAATVVNRGPQNCEVGGNELVSGQGFLLEVGEGVDVKLGSRDDDLYAVCANGEVAELHVLVE